MTSRRAPATAPARATIPGTGSWKVGYCVFNAGGSALNFNDWA